MSFYDIDGNLIRLDSGNMPDFDLIHTFSAFETDYSTNANTPKVLNISSDTFLNTFYDRYLGYNTNGVFVGKTALGKDTSDTYDVYQYEFRPQNYKRTFMISSGMHTYELPASFGLARWLQEYMEGTDDVFKWLRENVRVICIPIINPWGFNQNPKTYGDVNLVNINRNFNDLTDGWESYPVYTDEWNRKGSAPYSEKETQIIRDWAYKYADVAEFYMDCHTGLGCSRATYGDVWGYMETNNPNASKIATAMNALASYISTTYGVTAKIYTTPPSTDPGLNRKFHTNVAGIPFFNPEQVQGNDTAWQTVPNNCPQAITEYATQIHAYVIAQLK